jgi:hypothetical protein
MSIRRRSDVATFVALAAFAVTLTPIRARADPDPLDAYRDTFRRGMERYKAGAIAEAIPYWENVYRELGPAKGYRVAFNLARAYEALGDSTRSAQKYEAFIAEFETRQTANIPQDAVVETEAAAGRTRLAELVASKGRIRILAPSTGESSFDVRVDGIDVRAGDIMFVAPGAHSVTFAEGHDVLERRSLDVRAGALIDVTPPKARVTTPKAPAAPAPMTLLPAASETSLEAGVSHPFAPTVLYVAGGLTLAGGAVTAFAYASALDQRAAYQRAGTSTSEVARIAASYPNARTLAYVSLGATVTIAAATAGLTAYYVFGARSRATLVPTASFDDRGAWVFATGQF